MDEELMAIEGNDPADLDDAALEAAQRVADGEDIEHDPKEGDDTAQAAAAPAATQAAATPPPPAPTPAPDAAAAATTAAGAEDQPGKIAGVQSKEGDRVLPYSALQAERRAARAATGRAAALERELETAKQQLADLKAGKKPIDEVTEDDVKQMEQDFPEQGAKMRALFEKAQAAPTPAPKPGEAADDAESATQDAIDQVPLLLTWQHEDPQKWGRAVAIDAVLKDSPKWAGKPAVERFTKVAEMVAEEYDVPFEKPSASTRAPAATPPAPAPNAADTAQRKNPESLSDFKGGDVASHNTFDAKNTSPRQLLTRFEDMTDDEIDAHLAKYG